MAPIAPPIEPVSLTATLLPSLWLLASATLSTTRSRVTAPLTILTLCLAIHPVIHNLYHPSSPATSPFERRLHLHTITRQAPAPPQTSPLPTGASPSPTPSPAPEAPTQPPSTTAPPQTVLPPQPFSDQLTLDECDGGLKRMQVIILLELCFEIMFLFIRCFADQEELGYEPPVDVTMRGYVFIRAIYLVPVLGFNAGIYWVGGGPTGRCLSNFSAVQIPFVHLVFYALYCIIIVIIGVYRIDQYEKNNSYYESDDANYRNSGPPTRTTSYFRGYGNRRSTTESTSYEEPKFRVNLGCCRLNF